MTKRNKFPKSTCMSPVSVTGLISDISWATTVRFLFTRPFFKFSLESLQWKEKVWELSPWVHFNSCHCAHGHSLPCTYSFPRARKEKTFSLSIRCDSGICLTGLEGSLAESGGIYGSEALGRVWIAIQRSVSTCTQVSLIYQPKPRRLRTE